MKKPRFRHLIFWRISLRNSGRIRITLMITIILAEILSEQEAEHGQKNEKNRTKSIGA